VTAAAEKRETRYIVDPHLIDDRVELAPAHIADGILEPRGSYVHSSSCKQVAGKGLLGHHHDLPTATVRHSTAAGLTVG
jgi:hypothetical protein